MTDAPSSPQQTLLRELSMVSRKLRTLFDARVKSRGLTYARARMLLQLTQADGPTQGELAEALEIEQPTVVRQLDAMEAAGLLERRPCTQDRRAKRLFLTPAGRAEAEEVLAVTMGLRDELCAGLAEADLGVAAEVLRQVGLRIEQAS